MTRTDNHEFDFLPGNNGNFGADFAHHGRGSHDFSTDRRSLTGMGGFSTTSSNRLLSDTAAAPLNASSLNGLALNGGSISPQTQSLSLNHHQLGTLWWGELEPWMDEEYAKQVCSLMGWDPLSVKVPRPPPDPTTGQQANNPGYCFLTFPSPAQAGQVIAQISGGNTTMPNSSKSFVMNWASSVPPSAMNSPAVPSFSSIPILAPPASSSTAAAAAAASQNYPKEYSIFVGDLAPETSNSDLVAVFRNPVLGLRNDREPKFIRPFLSCKSAKIMLDPVTGVSRGYGFVRFTDETDQQRALIEMHGLYCLSRPMRISPATAKFKAPQPISFDAAPFNFTAPQADNSPPPSVQADPQSKSVSAPIAANPVAAFQNNGNSLPSSASALSPVSTSASGFPATTNSSEDLPGVTTNILAQFARQYVNGEAKPVSTSPFSPPDPFVAAAAAVASSQRQSPYSVTSPVEESWKHHAQARAILGNLIGPNGEQLTSTDPYNTTVFVGGLSPLISEDTLRTFFAPFGDIHYVKVPVGKHCGFVQFVRKADAERAIEKMQGFPVGGSRIRLSWGRSQYKAAQAAAQAAQTAALQVQYTPPVPVPASVPAPAPPQKPHNLTHDQAIALLQKFGYFEHKNGMDGNQAAAAAAALAAIVGQDVNQRNVATRLDDSTFVPFSSNAPAHEENHSTFDAETNLQAPHHGHSSSFSPFSPNPNLFPGEKRRDSSAALGDHGKVLGTGTSPFGHAAGQPTPNGTSPSNYFAGMPPELSLNIAAPASSSSKSGVSPTMTRPSSASKYGSFFDKHITPISRPSSSTAPQPQTPQDDEMLHDLNGTLASLDLDSKSNMGNLGSFRSSS